ncbi:hormogonium polysaccharide biosynthesis protein HpsL [Spirulina sp. CS-785/01]|uniref:hormogonium polysaccharide biosynthesis protein HpsL n=1 Tax=Spirulina sp. CS-785/01 TaxID=3021716 RepID=UPI0023303745|nr:hormogonium polysaccharide biosynthesis protein HpsL [Spirulina sp. CS-785/01]MDB9313260.1 hormogonium polysaccharide biosynthesis protein HpsL [Spirulina sp. CS-785/01]
MLKSKKRDKKKKSQQNDETANLSPKEIAAQKRKAAQDKKKLIHVITVCTACFLFIGLPAILIKPKIGLALGGGLPVMYFSYQYPRTALWMFFIYMPFSGTVIYQIVGGNAIFNLAKDGFFIPALIALYQDAKKKKKPIIVNKKILGTLIFLFATAMLTLLVVNGSMQFILPDCEWGENKLCKDGIPIAQGLLGLKVLMGYIPLIFCVYYLLEDAKKLLWVGRVHLLLAVACTLLGIVQFWMLDTEICQGTRHEVGDALFKASVDAKCLVGGAVGFSPSQNFQRLPGTFASPWHWAWFLIGNSAITFTVAFCDTSLFWRIGGLIGMVLVFVNAVISGQRIALALVPVITIMLLVFTGQVANLKRFVPIGIGLAVILTVVMANNPSLIEERVESLQSRASASPPQAFIAEQFHWAINEQRGFLGRGLGKATNSTRVFGDTALVETFHPKLLYEMGFLGLIAFISFTTNIFIVSLKIVRSTKTKFLRDFGSSLLVFVGIISFFPYWYPLDTDPVCVYYWLFVGMIFKLPDLDKQEQEKLKVLREQEAEFLRQKKNKKKLAQEPPLAS